jgi:hypothetical protein
VTAVEKAILESIGDAGFEVEVGVSGGPRVVEARSHGTGDVFIVRGRDFFTMVCDLAERCGVEPDDE